ncbi:MAG: thiamine pyrophosphate-binding protein, partial [Alphaproteobacteria bacterium]|nr:thiamine pyrophosphate-binding protein [Alphaproteobacteria bacterium]
AGVSRYYGLASGKLAPLYRALATIDTAHYTGVRHEAAAAFMATAIFAGAGELAVCLGETGPGGLNLLSGLGGAAANNLAVLAITSSNDQALTRPDTGVFSSTDNLSLFAPLMKWNARVHDPARIPELVRTALRAALSGRPGPVQLDIPADVLAATAHYDEAELDARRSDFIARSPTALPEAIAVAAKMMKAARRPLIIAGGGVIRAGGAEMLVRCAERLGAPVITTQMGTGAIPDDAPLCLGQGGLLGGPSSRLALEEADVVLALGCRFSSWMAMDGPPIWAGPAHQALIQVDIDPLMIGARRSLALGIVADLRCTLEVLHEFFAQTTQDNDPEWLSRLAGARAQYRAALSVHAEDTSVPMHPAALARAIGAQIGPSDLVVFDGGHTSFWSHDFTPALEPRTRFHEPGMSHLGFGLPWALALKQSAPERNVFCITGDGTMGFTLQELDTARREGLNIIVVVHNNARFGVIAARQARDGIALGTDLSDTDYAAIARAFGCHAELITQPEEVLPALDRARASGLPALIDARVRFEPHPMLPVFGRSSQG